MLFSTSLMAFVGAGEQPALTPRKLTVLNTATSTPIQDIPCASSVLAVRMNKTRCLRLGAVAVHAVVLS
jgi:autophagy-related protein 18